jgi:endonuclease YncB( thermonuclease family)
MSKTKENLFYYKATAKPEDVYDGDTFRVELDLGFRIKYATPVRLYGVNAAEMKDKSNEAKLAKLELQEFIRKNKGKLIIKSHGLDKYGRFLGEVWGDGEVDEASINRVLIKEGLALEYYGVGKKEDFDPSKQLKNDV